MRATLVRRLLVFTGVGVFTLGQLPVRATGDSFTVNTDLDGNDANVGDGVCATSFHVCSLRAAIQEAGKGPSGVVRITLPAGLYELGNGPRPAPGEWPLRELQIGTSLLIEGAGSATTIIDGHALAKSGLGTRLINIHPRFAPTSDLLRPWVSIRGVSMSGGQADPTRGGSGGAMLITDARVELEDCVIEKNDGALAGGGIAVYDEGRLTAAKVILRNNSAEEGGAIHYSGHSKGWSHGIDVTDSVIADNQATRGAGIYSSALRVRRTEISGNVASGEGGGLFFPPIAGGGAGAASGSLIEVRILGNKASRGGGLFSNFFSFGLFSSTISANTANDGGGLYLGTFLDGGSPPASVNIAQSTFTKNRAVRDGGAIYNGGELTIDDSTISDNEAGRNGGGLFNLGNLSGGGVTSLILSTVFGNSAVLGAALYNDYRDLFGGHVLGSPLFLHATIVADNKGLSCFQASPAFSPIDSRDYDVSDDVSCNADIFAAVVLLGPLSDNGGPTLTHLPLPGSPAIDAAPVARCPYRADQRGIVRPQGAACDIGSVEVAPNPFPTPPPRPVQARGEGRPR